MEPHIVMIVACLLNLTEVTLDLKVRNFVIIVIRTKCRKILENKENNSEEKVGSTDAMKFPFLFHLSGLKSSFKI